MTAILFLGGHPVIGIGIMVNISDVYTEVNKDPTYREKQNNDGIMIMSRYYRKTAMILLAFLAIFLIEWYTPFNLMITAITF